jgi:hypothetical protein
MSANGLRSYGLGMAPNAASPQHVTTERCENVEHATFAPKESTTSSLQL